MKLTPTRRGILALMALGVISLGVTVAVGNTPSLAEMAGKVTVTVKAESESGFDKSKLNNGVLEPLREANLIQ